MSGPDPARFDAITFDCYGTLIDWETGILAAMLPLLDRHEATASPADILTAYARAEAAAEAGPFVPYREVLRRTFTGLAKDLGFSPRAQGIDTLVDSLPEWLAFPDTVECLRKLKTRYKIGIISNVDEDLFVGTRAQLGIELDWVVTAGSIGAYKPDPLVFERALARMQVPRERVLHAAQSRYHDIAPARALGIPCVHVVRDSGRGAAAVVETDAEADWVVPDLRGLVGLLGL